MWYKQYTLSTLQQIRKSYYWPAPLSVYSSLKIKLFPRSLKVAHHAYGLS